MVVTIPSGASARRDLRAQREALVHNGFVTEVTAARLPDVKRYAQAMLVRLDKLPRDAERDKTLMVGVNEVEAEWSRLPDGPAKERIRWLLQELRVSLFAPSVKAKGPVSLQRVYRALDDL